MAMSREELRKQLKRVDNLVNGVGYEFRFSLGSFFLDPKVDNCENPICWVRMAVRKTYGLNGVSLYFTAEPCRLSGGSASLDVDFAEAICNHWKRLLNVCKTLNEMNICGNDAELRDLLIDIYARKRK